MIYKHDPSIISINETFLLFRIKSHSFLTSLDAVIVKSHNYYSTFVRERYFFYCYIVIVYNTYPLIESFALSPFLVLLGCSLRR